MKVTAQSVGEVTSPGIRFEPARDAGGYRLEAQLLLPQPREQLFEFFADAFELETITPPWLQFAVVSRAPIQMAEGTLIDYRLRLHGIRIRWQSRISAWEPPYRFVDEQTRGPYRRWHHEHRFDEVNGGTLCRDVVHYKVTGGALVNALFVRSDLRKIFTFRQQKLSELFASSVAGT